MIYIFSTEFDIPTDQLIERLYIKGIEVKRFNKLTSDDLIAIIKSPPTLIYVRKLIFEYTLFNTIKTTFKLHQFYKDEEIELLRTVLNLKSCKIIGWKDIFELPRITALQLAQKTNIQTPYFSITNTKKDITNLLEQYQQLIIRPIRDSEVFEKNNEIKLLHVQKISKKNLAKINTDFFPVLVMEALDKEIEIKVFFINGAFFASGIYSLSNAIDSRQYIGDLNTSIFPITIPNTLKSKLKKLINSFNLFFCTIDLILDKKGNYYFLDINPSGQYSYIDDLCNFNIDTQITNYICSIYENKMLIGSV
jgi:hypothetical protein